MLNSGKLQAVSNGPTTSQSKEGGSFRSSSTQMMDSKEESYSSFPDKDGSGFDDESGSESEDLDGSIIVLVHVVGQSRCSYIKDMLDIYREDFQQDNRGRHTLTIYEEPWILTFNFNGMSILHDTITQYRLDQLAAQLRKYSPIVVYEFYASYATTVVEATLTKAKPISHPRLTRTLV